MENYNVAKKCMVLTKYRVLTFVAQKYTSIVYVLNMVMHQTNVFTHE